MADKPEEPMATPWDDSLSDFTLILDSGQRLRCHKWQLAKASPVLRGMMMSIMKVSKTDEMGIPGYDFETVTSLLKYVYAKAQDTFKKYDDWGVLAFHQEFRLEDFGDTKLSPQLMRLAYKYGIDHLVYICGCYLEETKPNKDMPWTVKDIQTLAVDLNHERLKKCSDMWLASDAFQILMCGDCKMETRNPKVLLKCNDCDQLSDVSGTEARVLDKDGSKFDRLSIPSTVSIKKA